MNTRNVVLWAMLTMALICGCRSMPTDEAYPAGDGELINNETGDVIDVGPK